MCDRIIVMKDREKIAEFDAGPEVTVELIVDTIASHQAGDPAQPSEEGGAVA